MLTKTKTIRKNLKMENNKKKKNHKKNVLEIWWRGSYPQYWACIHATVSEKPEFTVDGRTTDGRTTYDGRLRHDSSSADFADKVTQS